MKRHYFVSDLHLGTWGDADRRARFLRFLEIIRPDVGALFILGDLFEFGFEYPDGIDGANADIARDLRRLVDSRVRVVFIKGNHDCWLSHRFTDRYGVEVHDSPYVEEIEGRRCCLAHGDDIDSSLRNQVFRRLFRSRLATRLFALVPRRLGRWLALRVADRSRVTRPDPRLVRAFERHAGRLLASGSDVVVLGHIHLQQLESINCGQYLNLGDWVTHCSYGVLDGSGLRLETFQPESRDRATKNTKTEGQESPTTKTRNHEKGKHSSFRAFSVSCLRGRLRFFVRFVPPCLCVLARRQVVLSWLSSMSELGFR